MAKRKHWFFFGPRPLQELSKYRDQFSKLKTIDFLSLPHTLKTGVNASHRKFLFTSQRLTYKDMAESTDKETAIILLMRAAAVFVLMLQQLSASTSKTATTSFGLIEFVDAA